MHATAPAAALAAFIAGAATLGASASLAQTPGARASDAATPHPAMPAATYVPHRVYDAREGRFIDFETLAARLATADVVLVGEQHGDPGTHRMQRALLEGLARRRGGIIVSMEQFERDVQPLLDDYLAGRVSEADFLAGARPWPNYARDYRPLVELARAAAWPVVAANVPRRIAAQVSREGLAALAALPPDERALAAREVSCPRDAYFERFVETIGHHPMPNATPEAQAAMAQRFYEAQCVKDETMAEAIAAAVAAAPGSLVVHTTGAFHCDFGQGTAGRAMRRLPGRRIVVVSALPVEDLDRPPAEENRARADYLLFTGHH